MATKRRPSHERHAQIAAAALQILAHDGPAKLTLASVGAAVGIADASVLRHFKDKQAIVDAAIARFAALLDEDLPSDITDPMRRLGAFFVRRLLKVRAHPEVMALAHNMRLRDAAGPEGAKVDAPIARSAQFIRRCVTEAQAQGMLAETVPAYVWVWIVAGILRGASAGLPPAFAAVEQAQDQLSPERTWELLEGILRSAKLD